MVAGGHREGKEGKQTLSVWSDCGVEATEQLCWRPKPSACRPALLAGKGHWDSPHINEDLQINASHSVERVPAAQLSGPSPAGRAGSEEAEKMNQSWQRAVSG